ncbi:MAG: MiaB-like tRNA modifying enzyme [Anaerocolumna sp.]|jgi:threonylcarbamoyladenosine tRNA methylthiotransferase MtaB|nr:MiaB-like tRNA modifying enzyme [Anaerocolumna sp.]
MDNRFNQEWNSKKVAFLTLGCKVNSYETEAMQKLFEEEGLKVVDFSDRADIYVINTCTVTNIADRKSRQMLHKAKKMNESALVVAVGCYVQASKEVLEQDNAVDVVVGNNKKKDIIGILKEHLYGNTTKEIQDQLNVTTIGEELEYEELNIEAVSEKTRAYIKIQDGCNQFCSYCIIPFARGRIRSRAKESVIAEVNRLVDKGYKEIVLTGIHLSSYGLEKTAADQGNNVESPLLNLIIDLNKIEGLKRIRLGSLEPRIITEHFAKSLSEMDKFCPHFHLSLQSGCDETLKRMNRRYNTTEYYEKCVLLRKYFNNPAITTDIIVGFPGETEEEFEKTREYLSKVSFAQMHIFKYSMRQGTKAATMDNQVKEEIKANRSSILISLGDELNKKYQESFIGKLEKVLIEESVNLNGVQYQVGHNEKYQKLAVIEEKDLTNSIISVMVKEQINKEIMFCEIMD